MSDQEWLEKGYTVNPYALAFKELKEKFEDEYFYYKEMYDNTPPLNFNVRKELRIKINEICDQYTAKGLLTYNYIIKEGE